MTAPERIVGQVLLAVDRRLRIERTLRLSASAILWLALAAAWGTLAGSWFAAVLGVIGLAVFVLLVRRTAPRKEDRHSRAAKTIERGTPDLRNVLISSVEILQGRIRTSEMFRAAVLAGAATRAADIQPRNVVPLGPSLRVFALSAIGASVLLVLMASSGVMNRRPARPGGAGVAAPSPENVAVQVSIIPPAYLHLPTRRISDPEQIKVIEGTAIEVVSARGLARWVAADGKHSVAAPSLRVTPQRDGFIAVQRTGLTRRVIPVVVQPDEAPRVTIARPAGDLQLSKPTSVSIEAEATDDHGLVSAELRYTRVSGSGEQFEFTSGILPIRVQHRSGPAWSLGGGLPLSRMGAVPGDTIVFRIAARDARGAAGEGQSDALMIEIGAPGSMSPAGAAIDPTEDRFALSQQMILLKLRQLHASRRSLSPSALQERSQMLAAQQRSVRALFVFMLGGEVEDEEVEASHSHEIQEGRLEDTSRRDLLLATNLMSRVEQHLIASDTGAALPPAEAAVEAVQRAFGRRRYFLRTTPVRMRIDPSRRLTGDTSEVRGASIGVPAAARDSSALRVLEDLAVLLTSPEPSAARPAEIAARLLALDPASADLQHMAASLQQSESASDLREIAARVLNELIDRERRRQPGALRPVSPRAFLRSAWAEQWLERGVRP